MNRVVTITVSMMDRVTKKKRRIKRAWTDEERLLHTHQKLRATTIPNKKRVLSKQAARRKFNFFSIREE